MARYSLMLVREVKVDRIRPTFRDFMSENDLILVITSDDYLIRFNIEYHNGSQCQFEVITSLKDGENQMAKLVSGQTMHFCGKNIHVPTLRLIYV
jgi:hypothetical protein